MKNNNGCDYCKGGGPNKYLFYDHHKAYAYVGESSDELYVRWMNDVSIDDNTGKLKTRLFVTKIRFCPMCGKNLRKEK